MGGEEDYIDQWFYNSIKRYGKLIMFEMEDAVQQIELSDKTSVCALGKRKSGKNVIAEFSVPSELYIAAEDDIIQGRDMKIKSGLIVDYGISQIAVVYEQEKVLASVEGLNGVKIYRLNNGETDKISEGGIIDLALENPFLAISGNLLALSKDSSQVSLVVDVECGRIIFSVNNCSESSKDELKPLFISENIFGLYQITEGNLTLHDLRQRTPIGCIDGDHTADTGWTASSNYYDKLSTCCLSSSIIGFLNSAGFLKIFDLRELAKVRCETKLSFIRDSGKMQMLSFNPVNSDIISVLGFDRNIYIYDLKNDVKNIFVHDGHAYTEDCDRETLTTSQIWYKPAGDNVLISSALNRSINCWQFNAHK